MSPLAMRVLGACLTAGMAGAVGLLGGPGGGLQADRDVARNEHATAESTADVSMPQGVEATVDDLAFIAGDWELTQGKDVLSEHWSEPRGDCLMGSFRWQKAGGKVWMYEFLTMRNEEDGVTMRFRHFDGQLHAWEEKQEPITLRLVELKGNRAVFSHFGGDDVPWNMIFNLLDEGSLTISLTKEGQAEKDGKRFPYKRPVREHEGREHTDR